MDGWKKSAIQNQTILIGSRSHFEKGFVKMGNFNHSQKKLDYAYLLTPSGIKSKAVLTAHFLERKAAEYAALKRELDGIGAATDIKGLGNDTKTGQIENLEKRA